MKNIVLTIICLIFAGCATSGYMTAKHNGKMYWVPENCEKYQYYNSDPDILYCFHNDTRTGTIMKPADSTQVQNYYAKQQAESASLKNNSYRQTVKCKRFGDIGFDAKIYEFDSSICPFGYTEF